MASSILERLKAMLDQDKMAQLVADDPALTAELLLLFRMILADGNITEEELFTFKRICKSAFGLDTEQMDGVYKYLEDFSYETSSEQSAAIFKDLPIERRKELLDHMIAIAEADDRISPSELSLLGRTADMLGFDLKGGTANG